MFAFDKVFGMFTKLSLINEGQAKLKKHCRIVAQEDLRPGPSFRSSLNVKLKVSFLHFLAGFRKLTERPTT